MKSKQKPEAVQSYVLAEVPAALIVDLRHRVLRDGLPPESAMFKEDGDPGTRHFAAVLLSGGREGTVIGCASFVRCLWNEEQAYQLRGMAVDPKLQGLGIGRELLAYGEMIIADGTGIKMFWCHARLSAVPFYEKQGWETVSETFEIEGAGPHRNMTKRLN